MPAPGYTFTLPFLAFIIHTLHPNAFSVWRVDIKNTNTHIHSNTHIEQNEKKVKLVLDSYTKN